MRIDLSVNLAAWRAKAELLINARFDSLSAQRMHRVLAHARKKQIAREVLGNGEDVAPEEFRAEAVLAKISVTELAGVIARKPDEFLQREFERRRMLLAVRSAVSVAELQTVLQAIGLSLDARPPMSRA